MTRIVAMAVVEDAEGMALEPEDLKMNGAPGSNVPVPEAVLVRALEPVLGLEAMRRRRRAARRDAELASGPGKLCRALGITRALNGADLRGRELWIVRGTLRPGERIVRGPRVGVDYAGPDAARPLRYWLEGDPHVSRAPVSAASKRRRR